LSYHLTGKIYGLTGVISRDAEEGARFLFEKSGKNTIRTIYQRLWGDSASPDSIFKALRKDSNFKAMMQEAMRKEMEQSVEKDCVAFIPEDEKSVEAWLDKIPVKYRKKLEDRYQRDLENLQKTEERTGAHGAELFKTFFQSLLKQVSQMKQEILQIH